jgi:hypothetical protein
VRAAAAAGAAAAAWLLLTGQVALALQELRVQNQLLLLLVRKE